MPFLPIKSRDVEGVLPAAPMPAPAEKPSGREALHRMGSCPSVSTSCTPFSAASRCMDSADRLRISVKNTFIDVAPDSPASPECSWSLERRGAATCVARFSDGEDLSFEGLLSSDESLPTTGPPLLEPAPGPPSVDSAVEDERAAGSASPPPAAYPGPARSTRKILLQLPVELRMEDRGPMSEGCNLQVTVADKQVTFEGGRAFVNLRLSVRQDVGPTLATNSRPHAGAAMPLATTPPAGVLAGPASSASVTCMGPPASFSPLHGYAARAGAASASGEAAAPSSPGRRHITKVSQVCCHWKNKGWCKYEGSCKFMHPDHKRGVGVSGGAGSPTKKSVQRLGLSRSLVDAACAAGWTPALVAAASWT